MLAWMGGLGISEHHGIVSPAYAVYGLIEDHNANYLGYLYRTKVYLGEFARKSTGVVPSRWRMYSDDFGQVSTLLPPKETQNRIVKFLDAKTAAIDEAIAKKRRLIELLNEQKAILINRAVTKGLNPDAPMKSNGIGDRSDDGEAKAKRRAWFGDLPDGWKSRKLKYVAELRSEREIALYSSLRYIGLENIHSWSGSLSPSESEPEGLASKFFVGDVLFGKLRPNLAKVYATEFDGLCSTDVLVLEPKAMSARYLLYTLISRLFIELVSSSVFGAKMPRASWDFIGKQLVPLPDLATQNRIVRFLDAKSAEIDEAFAKEHRLIDLLSEFKQTLIANAVTGKIKI